MAEIYDTLLLIALPASGKSEVRNYLSTMNPDKFHMGPTVQLDDYPYVHLQIRTDEELMKLGRERIFHADEGPFFDSAEWGGLIKLLNEDYSELLSGKPENPKHAAKRLFERFDKASVDAGGKAKITVLPQDVQDILAKNLEAEARKLFDEKAANCPESLDGKTIVIEYARGGPADKGFPLPEGYGYLSSISSHSAELLEKASILYIWVLPEESRRKNRARARPDGQGSILFHGTPEAVMYQEYGCDDVDYLLEKAVVPGTFRISSEGKDFDIPVSKFDNRVDLTTFLREDADKWSDEDINKIHGVIKDACGRLWECCGPQHKKKL